MDMWLIHSWFCYYLFHNWIYGFKYPVIIFMVLLVCSVASAMVVRWIISGSEKGWNKVLSMAR